MILQPPPGQPAGVAHATADIVQCLEGSWRVQVDDRLVVGTPAPAIQGSSAPGSAGEPRPRAPAPHRWAHGIRAWTLSRSSGVQRRHAFPGLLGFSRATARETRGRPAPHQGHRGLRHAWRIGGLGGDRPGRSRSVHRPCQDLDLLAKLSQPTRRCKECSHIGSILRGLSSPPDFSQLKGMSGAFSGAESPLARGRSIQMDPWVSANLCSSTAQCLSRIGLCLSSEKQIHY